MKIYKNYSKYRNFSLLPCTIMKQKHNIWTIVIVLLFIWIIVFFVCPFNVNAPVNSPTDDTAISYNEESRKTMISSDCTFFFDWCNDCARQENWEVVCHELYCEIYKKPVCKDDEFSRSEQKNENIECKWTECVKNISREEAKGLILEWKVKKIFQAHSLDVLLEAHDGNEYLTIEPEIDEIFDVVDECGESCKDIRLGTE